MVLESRQKRNHIRRLRPARSPKAFGAGPTRIRTWDQGIMSPLL